MDFLPPAAAAAAGVVGDACTLHQPTRLAAICAFFACWTLLLLSARSIARRFWVSFELTDAAVRRGKSRDTFPLVVAIGVCSAAHACVVALPSLHLAVQYLLYAHPRDTVYMWETHDEQMCAFFRSTQLMAVPFTGYLLFLNLGLVMRWESDWDNYVHHIGFLVLTLISTHYPIFPELGMFALAMELSTIPLSFMLVLREPKGYEWALERVLGPIFGITFMLTRVVLFGVALFRHFSLYLSDPDVFSRGVGSDIPAGVMATVQTCYVAMWCLQLYWAWAVIIKYLITGKQYGEEATVGEPAVAATTGKGTAASGKKNA